MWKGEEEDDYEMVEELPFDSERKKMSIVRRADQDIIAFTKGAPDLLLRDCSFILEDGAGASAHGRRPRAHHESQRRPFGPGPARPGRRFPAPRAGAPLLHGRGHRAGPDLRRARGHDRPAPVRGPRRHGQVPAVGHPDGHDHRRPQEHGRWPSPAISASMAPNRGP
ncbi:MAG: hypothetical protein M0C28_02480 [Candidatus Moduliflexus flocculans]|nr:hypothetical protein [Candidatus Moduliflexus flocculans]